MQFQAGNISVDEHFARFGSKSYAINKLTSVDVLERKPGNGGWLTCAVIAALMGFAAFGALLDPAPNAGGTGYLGIAVVFAGLAWWIRRGNRPTYQLMLATAGGEVQAMTTQDLDIITRLRAALEAQIAQH